MIENLVEAIPGEPAALWREINLEIAHGHITKIIIIIMVIWIMLTMIVKVIIIMVILIMLTMRVMVIIIMVILVMLMMTVMLSSTLSKSP